MSCAAWVRHPYVFVLDVRALPHSLKLVGVLEDTECDAVLFRFLFFHGPRYVGRRAALSTICWSDGDVWRRIVLPDMIAFYAVARVWPVTG